MATLSGYKFLDQDDDYLHGAVRIKGTRLSVSMIARDVKAGSTSTELVEIFPELSNEAIEEALKYSKEHGEHLEVAN